jgi:hypothetical protein
VLTLSNNASQGFIKLLGPHAHGVIVTQVFPNERSISYPLINEAVKLAKAQGLSGVTPAMMEGFAAAKVLVEGLRRAGPNPTGQRLRDALEGLGDFDLGGMKLSYGSASRTGLGLRRPVDHRRHGGASGAEALDTTGPLHERCCSPGRGVGSRRQADPPGSPVR